ncbi:MAG: AarF/ABC1/UbiB kinase family protein [Lentisphaerae bacterium]|jgi:ubiquinone biosynthesis protein|nr:AarF/ABC1/UbiB kinase family protein [Lentisphaerota bacterium]
MSSIDRIRKLPGAYRRLGRFRKIVHVFMKYGFESAFESLRSKGGRLFKKIFLPWKNNENNEIAAQYTLPERLRMAFVELGPTFVKLGQVLATRQDIVPPEFIHEFSKLQDDVPPFPTEQVKLVIQEELDTSLDNVFLEFEDIPVGAASIAQGHRAKLKDGTKVFVKIQRPDIAKDIRLDLEILTQLAYAIQRHSEEFGFLRPVKIIEEFSKTIDSELDFSREMSNQLRFERQFADREGIKIPKIYQQYCTKKLLVMDYVEGIKGTDLDTLKRSDADLVKLSNLGAQLILEQFFEHGFFHADPHPGNLFFQLPATICYVDFGMVGRITHDEQKLFADLLLQLVMRNYKACALILASLAENDARPNLGELERDINTFADQHLHRTLESLDVSGALHDLYQLCYRQQMFLKPHIYLMLKALGSYDQLGRSLNPDFEIMTQVKPYVGKLLIEQFNPMTILHRSKSFAHEASISLEEMPRDVRQLFSQLLQGKLHFEHTLEGINKLIKVFNGAFNRLASAIVLAAMLVGSSIVIHANPKPHWYETSIMGLLGFLFSGLFGIVLLWDMLKHRE